MQPQQTLNHMSKELSDLLEDKIVCAILILSAGQGLSEEHYTVIKIAMIQLHDTSN